MVLNVLGYCVSAIIVSITVGICILIVKECINYKGGKKQ